jgi:LmbE family N-acetylglucosaminyl deacetylase
MKKRLYLLIAFFLSTCCGAFPQEKNPPTGKVILAIFAHPDDEEVVAPVLAKYATEGVTVYLAVVTDGRLGVSSHAKIPAGDTLAAVRVEEIRCAAANMGIKPPILLGFHDQLDVQQGFGTEFGRLMDIRGKIVKLFEDLKPDVVITWSPGGWTGHPDHRLVGDVVTEVFGGTHWNKPVSLYFPGLPSDNTRVKGSGYDLALVDPAYLTVQIELSNKDMAMAKAAWLCHKSQYVPSAIDHSIWVAWDKEKPVAYFRPFFSNGAIQKTLFP